MSKKRIEWVDVVKYVCIIAVIMRHMEVTSRFWYNFSSAFLLKGFFFVSGYVYFHSDDFKGFLAKKAKGLLVPWFVFSTFNILLSQIISFNQHGSFWEEMGWNLLQIRDHGDGIWFVAALFVAFIPFYFVIKWSDGKRQGKVISAILLSFLLSLGSQIYMKVMPSEVFPWGSPQLPWHLEYIFQAMFFMVLGYYFKRNFEEKFEIYNTIRNRILILGVYFIVVFLPKMAGIEIPAYVDIVYLYICELLGVFTLVSICKGVKTNSYISYVGKNTLIYFALHGKIISVIETVIRKIVPGIYGMVIDNTLLACFWMLLFALIISVVLIIPAWIINKYFPFVMGRSYAQKNLTGKKGDKHNEKGKFFFRIGNHTNV